MPQKTKRIVNLIAAAVILIPALLIFSWFNVRGAEFSFLDELPDDCEVTVTKHYWDPVSVDSVTTEFALNQTQLAQLLDLVRGSSYWRDPSSAITYSGVNTDYYILICFNRGDTAHYVSISSYGDYAIDFSSSLGTPFDDDFYHIRNSNWLTQLEAILAS